MPSYYAVGAKENKPLSEENCCNWNKATLTHILARQEYCGDIVNFKTAKRKVLK